MKKFCYILLATTFLLCCIGCQKQETETASVSLKTVYRALNKIPSPLGESTDCDILLECEEVCENLSIESSISDYSGSGYLAITDNTAFEITVDLPASQYYEIIVSHCAGSHKENPLLFNGSPIMNIISEEGDFVQTTVNGIYLEKGKNTITLGEGWSWFYLDYIRITNGSCLEDSFYDSSDQSLINPNASEKTQRIYQYLLSIYGKRTLAGQCTNYGTNTETDALFWGLGKYPALRTFDFIYDSYSACQGKPKARDVDLAIEWDKKGGLVAFDWHWYAPYGKSAFYTDATEFRITNARTDLDIASLSFEELQSLYAEGSITIETFMLMYDIDNIASLLLKLQDENVTVLWRPMHEASGGWFWWGATGADDYKWLWKLMYERMTNYHALNNLIWVWNAQDSDWYPGDEYCDISSADVYHAAHDYSTDLSQLMKTSATAGNKKMSAQSECATMIDPDLMIQDNVYWLWFAVWNWDYIVVNGTTTLSEDYTSLEMMQKVYDSEAVITLDELPDFN